MSVSQIAVLVLVCTSAAVQSQPYPCPGFNVSRPEVSAGSNVDIVMRHGILPTKIKYPEIVKDGDSEPVIELAPARAPSPFVDSFAWDNETCFEFFDMPVDGDVKAKNLFTTESSSQDIYDIGGRVYGSAFVSTDGISSLNDYMALSQDKWNNSYYNNVRNELLGLDSCSSAELLTISQTLAKGRVINATIPECQSFSKGFVNDVFALPLNLEGNMGAYMDFCNKYGWYVPQYFYFSSLITRVEVTDDSGTTTYHFGQAGVSDFSDDNCQDPEVGLLDVLGWDAIGVLTVIGTNLTAIAANFETFYETYPVDDRALPPIETLKEEQIFTYEGVPEGCSGTTSTATMTSLSMELFLGIALVFILSLV